MSIEKEKLLQEIENSLNSIRPFLHEDGGDVKIVSISEDYIVEVEFEGSCKDCSMSNLTFKNGIRDTILKSVSQVKDVKIVDKTSYLT